MAALRKKLRESGDISDKSSNDFSSDDSLSDEDYLPLSGNSFSDDSELESNVSKTKIQIFWWLVLLLLQRY